MILEKKRPIDITIIILYISLVKALLKIVNSEIYSIFAQRILKMKVNISKYLHVQKAHTMQQSSSVDSDFTKI